MSSIPQATLSRVDTGPPWETAVIVREITVTLPGQQPDSSSSSTEILTPPAAASSLKLPPSRYSYSSDEFDPAELKREKTTTTTPDEERSLKAWLQVLASFLLLVNGYGYYSSFGAFQGYWQTTLQRSPADISWTGSLQLSLPFIGAVSGRFMDQGYFRSILVVGCLLQLVGIFVTSLVERPSQYVQLLLAQGIVQGLGNGVLFTPSVTLVSLYFKRYRAFALGVASCGAPIGGVIFTMVSDYIELESDN